MIEFGQFAAIAFVTLGIVFVAETIYVLFLRDFGLMTFRLSFHVPRTDPRTVWTTYYDGVNDWNSIIERLSYEVVSEHPRIVRSRARMRGTDDVPITTTWRLDVTAPERSCRATVISIDGVDVPAAQQGHETFNLCEGEHGTTVDVEVAVPIRGWLRVPLHRRNIARIFEDLRMACLEKANVPFRAEERPWWSWRWSAHERKPGARRIGAV